MRHSVRFRSAAGIAAATVLLAAACNWDRPFPDEYYDGHNFIANLDFSAFQGTASGILGGGASYVEPGANGAWDWQWRGATRTSGYALPGSPGGMDAGGGEFPYMTLDLMSTAALAAADATYTPPPTGAGAYRLAVANLLPAGDFEGALPTGTSGSGVTNNLIDVANGAIRGMSAQFAIDDTNKYIELDLSAGLLDRGVAAVSGHDYSIDFYYQDQGFDLLTTTGGLEATLASVAASVVPFHYVLANPVSIGSGETVILRWGAYSTTSPFTNLVVDDLRVFRSDLSNVLSLRLLRSDTSPVLEAGYYEFGLWVRDDPAAYSPGDTEVTGPYDATTLTLVMHQPLGVNQNVVEAFASYSRTEDSGWAPGGTPAGWKRLAVRFAAGNNTTFPPDAAGVALELNVVLSASAGIADQAGSILVAGPELLFYPNGY